MYIHRRMEMEDIEVAVKTRDAVNEKIAMETLFSYLGKGIDDMEAGRMQTVDEAFQIIRERMNNELLSGDRCHIYKEEKHDSINCSFC